jgi:hypothetical protein
MSTSYYTPLSRLLRFPSPFVPIFLWPYTLSCVWTRSTATARCRLLIDGNSIVNVTTVVSCTVNTRLGSRRRFALVKSFVGKKCSVKNSQLTLRIESFVRMQYLHGQSEAAGLWPEHHLLLLLRCDWGVLPSTLRMGSFRLGTGKRLLPCWRTFALFFVISSFTRATLLIV